MDKDKYRYRMMRLLQQDEEHWKLQGHGREEAAELGQPGLTRREAGARGGQRGERERERGEEAEQHELLRINLLK